MRSLALCCIGAHGHARHCSTPTPQSDSSSVSDHFISLSIQHVSAHIPGNLGKAKNFLFFGPKKRNHQFAHMVTVHGNGRFDGNARKCALEASRDSVPGTRHHLCRYIWWCRLPFYALTPWMYAQVPTEPKLWTLHTDDETLTAKPWTTNPEL